MVTAVMNETDMPSEEEMRKNILEVDIFFQTMRVTTIEEDWDFPPFEMVSACGGIMGLFLAASIMGVLEILDLFAAIAIVLFCQVKRKVVKQRPAQSNGTDLKVYNAR